MRLMWQKYRRNHYDLDLTECGIQQCTPLDAYDYTATRDYVIHYVMAGKGVVGSAGKPLQAGQLFVFKKGQRARYAPDFTTPWEYCWVAFGGALADKYLGQYDFVHRNVISPGAESALGQAMVDLNTTLYQEPAKDTELFRLTQIHHVFLALCEALGLNAGEPHANALNDTFSAALAFINTHYQSGISVAAVADHLHISRGYLYQLFIDNLQTSPQAYLIRLRLFRASQLLTGTSLSIKEIAAQVGYPDQLYFSAQFKKHYRQSPTQFRATPP